MTKRDVFIHLGLAFATSIVLILLVFYWLFPSITNHGESMTVPNLEGIQLTELEEFLEERDLRFEVEPDSGYSSQFPPLAVLQQFPLAGAKVKENRKIYVILNAQNPPVVKVPTLKGRSLKNAQLELRSLGLALGKITYQPDFALNTVLEQYYNGKPVKEDQEVPKGSKIDFEVGDGLGNQNFSMLDLKDLELEEAIFVLRGNGLNLGEVYYSDSGNVTLEEVNNDGETVYYKRKVDAGRIYKQLPKAKTLTKLGQSVDLWLVKPDSTKSNSDSPSLGEVSEEN